MDTRDVIIAWSRFFVSVYDGSELAATKKLFSFSEYIFWISAVIKLFPYINGAPLLLTVSNFLRIEYSVVGDGVKLPNPSKVTFLSTIVLTVALANATVSDDPSKISTISPTLKADGSGVVFKLNPLLVLSTKNLELVL